MVYEAFVRKRVVRSNATGEMKSSKLRQSSGIISYISLTFFFSFFLFFSLSESCFPAIIHGNVRATDFARQTLREIFSIYLNSTYRSNDHFSTRARVLAPSIDIPLKNRGEKVKWKKEVGEGSTLYCDETQKRCMTAFKGPSGPRPLR
ncbi:hypothetical protein PUN28_007918 [Cardiocondyla obscurior]|uniref:Uncharacterized protein n=1 Tax=Cardiocondyla obscurior TaxID=286306 RepID=A0AAW2FYI9_9HYME